MTASERGNDFRGWAIYTDGGTRVVDGEGRNRLWPKPTLANTNWPILAKPILAQIGVSVFGELRRVGPSKGGAQTQKKSGAEGWGVDGAPKGEGPKISRFFSSPATISLFLCLSGCLLVEFWWCLKRRGAQMCTFEFSGCRVKPRRPRSRRCFTQVPTPHTTHHTQHNNTTPHHTQHTTHNKSNSIWPKSVWPKSVLAKVGFGQSRFWPKSVLAKVGHDRWETQAGWSVIS